MKRVVVAGAITIFASLGCSGGGGSADGAAPSGGSCTAATTKGCFGSCNTCTILTVAEVDAVVGVQVVDPGTGDGDPHTCDWLHNDQSGLPDLQVIAYSNINAHGFGAICHPAVVIADAGITVTPVAGVGDDACIVRATGLGGPVLNFIKDCWAYSISVAGATPAGGTSTLDDATIEADEKALALDALSNL